MAGESIIGSAQHKALQQKTTFWILATTYQPDTDQGKGLAEHCPYGPNAYMKRYEY